MTKEDAKKLADLRNKMGPIYSYFQILKTIKKEELRSRKKKLKKLAIINEELAIETMNKIKEILDSFK